MKITNNIISSNRTLIAVLGIQKNNCQNAYEKECRRPKVDFIFRNSCTLKKVLRVKSHKIHFVALTEQFDKKYDFQSEEKSFNKKQILATYFSMQKFLQNQNLDIFLI